MLHREKKNKSEPKKKKLSPHLLIERTELKFEISNKPPVTSKPDSLVRNSRKIIFFSFIFIYLTNQMILLRPFISAIRVTFSTSINRFVFTRTLSVSNCEYGTNSLRIPSFTRNPNDRKNIYSNRYVYYYLCDAM